MEKEKRIGERRKGEKKGGGGGEWIHRYTRMYWID